jgi:hypothetical protein
MKVEQLHYSIVKLHICNTTYKSQLRYKLSVFISLEQQLQWRHQEQLFNDIADDLEDIGIETPTIQDIIECLRDALGLPPVA